MINHDSQIDLTVLITHISVYKNIYCYHTLDVKMSILSSHILSQTFVSQQTKVVSYTLEKSVQLVCDLCILCCYTGYPPLKQSSHIVFCLGLRQDGCDSSDLSLPLICMIFCYPPHFLLLSYIGCNGDCIRSILPRHGGAKHQRFYIPCDWHQGIPSGYHSL